MASRATASVVGAVSHDGGDRLALGDLGEQIRHHRRIAHAATDRVLALAKITQHNDNAVHGASRNTTQLEVKRGFLGRFLGR